VDRVNRILRGLDALASLFGPDASAPVIKNGGTAEAGRQEVDAMLSIARETEHSQVDIEISPQSRMLFSAVQHSEVRRIEALLSERIKRAVRLPADEMITETVTLTPAMAEWILQKHNQDNRGLRRPGIERFAKIIREGAWKVTSQGISFARDGRLNNGQHRLHGIIRAGRPVSIRITFGEDRDAFSVLDTNAVRGGSDTLFVAGYKNTGVLASTARLLAIVESGNPLLNLTVDNDAVLEMLKKHPRLQEAALPGKRVGKKFRCSTAGVTLAFYLIDAHSPRAQRLGEFVDRLVDAAGQGSRSPILAVRDGLMTKTIDAHFRSAGNRGVAQAAAVIKAWNAWVSNRKGNSLRWEAGEPFPLPV
jgi:hypothetical protein